MKTSAATMETAENKAKSIVVEKNRWRDDPSNREQRWESVIEMLASSLENFEIRLLFASSKLRNDPPGRRISISREGKSSIKTFSSFSLFIGGHGGHGFYDLWNTLPHNNYSAIGRCCSIERFFICIFIVPRACTCVGGGGGKSSDQRNNKCAVKINGLINTSLLPAKYFSTFS